MLGMFWLAETYYSAILEWLMYDVLEIVLKEAIVDKLRNNANIWVVGTVENH